MSVSDELQVRLALGHSDSSCDIRGKFGQGQVSTTGRLMTVGSAWVVVTRWALRLLGVASTIVLARLLSPDDFGLVAMATVVVGLVQVFSDTGQGAAIIRLKHVERAHYDTVWTIRTIIGIGIALVLVLVAPFVVAYFQEPRVEGLIYVLALGPLIGGMNNIRTVDFRRELRFEREFQLTLWPKLASLATTIGLAWLWRDYRALIVGILVFQVVNLVVGYAMRPYRPRFCFTKAAELWSFSIWSLVTNVAYEFCSKIDQLVIGRLHDVTDLGRYSVAAGVGAMIVEELVASPSRALYSGFSRLLDDVPKLRESYLSALSIVLSLAIASSVGLSAVAEDVTVLLLGEKWRSVASLVPFFALAAAFWGACSTNYAILTALGYPRRTAISQWLFGVALIPSMLIAQEAFGLPGVAGARVVCSAGLFVAVQIVVCRLLSIETTVIAGLLWRPVLAAIVMVLAIEGLKDLAIAIIWTRLAVHIVVGGAVFCAVHFLAWWAAGQPKGVEKIVWHLFRPEAA
ncbi:MAG: lipopolysaccharide biosynthesis protein [Alphaproteobacteria bacterium]|nr:lipopolysaccharide biosynthesis protein [Alphaproteobacteria bacterium]